MTLPLQRRWIPVPAAAEVTGRHPETVNRWIRTGRLVVITVAGTRHVNELALLELEATTRRASRAGRPGRQGPRLRIVSPT